MKNEMVPDADLMLAAVDDEMASISSDDGSRAKGREMKSSKLKTMKTARKTVRNLSACLRILIS